MSTYQEGTVRASRLHPDPATAAAIENVKRHKRDRRLVISGYVWAVLMPIVGLIHGIKVARLADVSASRHGWRIMALSVVAWAVAIAILT